MDMRYRHAFDSFLKALNINIDKLRMFLEMMQQLGNAIDQGGV